MMKIIHVDYNNITNDGSLPLTSPAVLQEISALENPLENQELVYLIDDDIWTIAMVFQEPDGSWTARPRWIFYEEKPSL